MFHDFLQEQSLVSATISYASSYLLIISTQVAFIGFHALKRYWILSYLIDVGKYNNLR